MSKNKNIENMFYNSNFDTASNKLIANLDFSSTKTKAQSISVVSAERNDGKTVVTCNLAKAYANRGDATLLVDADIHQKSIAKVLGNLNNFNIHDVLSRRCSPEQAIIQTPINNLYFVDCASQLTCIPEILSNELFPSLIDFLKQGFKHIVFDTPPVISCVDSVLISNVVDSTIFVAREKKTKKSNITSAFNQLQIAKANIVGTVLTFSSANKSEYYTYYGKTKA